MPLAAYLQEVDRNKWRETIGSFSDHNFENSIAYIDAQAERLKTKNRLFLVCSDQGVEAAIVVRVKPLPMMKRGIAYVSSGPVWLKDGQVSGDLERFSLIIKLLKQRLVQEENQVLLIRLPAYETKLSQTLDALFKAQDFEKTKLVRAYKTALLNLNPAETVLRANLHSKWRNMLNQSEKAGLSIEIGTDTSFWKRFETLYAEMKETKEFSTELGPDFFAKLECESAGLVFLVAKLNGKDVGCLVMSALGRSVIYLFGATNTEGRDLRAGYFLMWHAIMHFKKNNYIWFDLGGVDDDSNHGGFQFKARMGGEIVDAVGPYAMFPSGPIAKVLKLLLNFRNRQNS